MGNQTCWAQLSKIHQFRLDEAIIKREQLQHAQRINLAEKSKLEHSIEQNMNDLSSCYNSGHFFLAYATNYLAKISTQLDLKNHCESDAKKLNTQVDDVNMKIKQHFHQKQVLARIEELRLKKNSAQSLKNEEKSMDDLIAIRQSTAR